MNKLLNKTLRVYALYASIVLILSLPIYHWLIEKIWTGELDEHNRIVAATVKHNLQGLDLSSEEFANSLDIFNALQPGVTIEPVNAMQNDTVINFYRHTMAFPHKTKQDRFQSLTTYFEYKGKSYRLVSEVNMEESYDIVVILTATKIVFLSLLLIGLFALNRYHSKRLWAPFYKTLEKLQRYEIHKNEPLILAESDVSEFQELNKQIEALIDRTRNAYILQKEFTENASHELQTPLAILRSKLDLFIQLNHLSPQQKLIINETQQALNRLIFFSKNLLLLSKIENSQFRDTTEVEVDQVIEEVLMETEAMVDMKQIRIEQEIQKPTKVRANLYLLGVLIKNLWTNAVKHTENGGEVSIITRENEIILSNAGDESLNPDLIFRRFTCNSKNPSNSGLGLPIVKEIVNQHNWKIDYYFMESRHHFKVSF